MGLSFDIGNFMILGILWETDNTRNRSESSNKRYGCTNT